MSVASNSVIHTGSNNLVVSPAAVAVPRCFLDNNNNNNNHQLNVVPLSRRSRFFGLRLRGSGSERHHLWRSDGPGRPPKLKVVVRSALSLVPEKPLGLYDPSFDKDSCGVGFVAELSGESSRKTV